MAEYIELEAAMDAILSEPTNAHYPDWYAAILMRVPTAVDVSPVVSGKWVWRHRHRGGINTYVGKDEMGKKHRITIDERYEVTDPYCPFCGKLNDGSWLNFCSYCGAKMDGDKNA